MDFNTNNFEIFSCQHVSAMLNLKKKILCVCVSDWKDFDYFSGIPSLLQAMSTMFFLKKKICVDFNTKNFEIFSCQHVSAMLNLKKKKMFVCMCE